MEVRAGEDKKVNMSKSLKTAIDFSIIGLKQSSWPMTMSHFFERQKRFGTILDIGMLTSGGDVNLQRTVIANYIVDLCAAMERALIESVWLSLHRAYSYIKNDKTGEKKSLFIKMCSDICGLSADKMMQKLSRAEDPLLALALISSHSLDDINATFTPVWNVLMDDDIEKFTNKIPNIVYNHGEDFIFPFTKKNISKNKFYSLSQGDSSEINKCIEEFLIMRNNFLHKAELPESINDNSDLDYYTNGIASFVMAAFYILDFASDHE